MFTCSRFIITSARRLLWKGIRRVNSWTLCISQFQQCPSPPSPIYLNLSKTRVSNARGFTPGYANAQPLGRDKIANLPPLGLTTWANAMRLPRGDGHCWNWLMHYWSKWSILLKLYVMFGTVHKAGIVHFCEWIAESCKRLSNERLHLRKWNAVGISRPSTSDCGDFVSLQRPVRVWRVFLGFDQNAVRELG